MARPSVSIAGTSGRMGRIWNFVVVSTNFDLSSPWAPQSTLILGLAARPRSNFLNNLGPREFPDADPGLEGNARENSRRFSQQERCLPVPP
eukprot:421701-Heterocapsa_arctica.AAC.1